MSTVTLTWECQDCGEEYIGLPPTTCTDSSEYEGRTLVCEGSLKLRLDEQSLPLILRSFHSVQERAESIADALGYSGTYGCDFDFDGVDDLDSRISVEWEERTCGCCSGDMHYESIPVRMLLGTDEEAKAYAQKTKEERLAKQKLEREAAQLRADKIQKGRELAQLASLQAKYGGAR